MSSTDIVTFNVNTEIAPERVFNFAHECDPHSFGWFITALSKKAGELYDWNPPPKKEGQSEQDYQKELDASYMELTGKTLSNVISSGKGYAGLWAATILSRGLTLIPEFMADDESDGLDLPLKHWFDQCELYEVLGPDVISRITSFLLEVAPQCRRYERVDDQIVSLLVDTDKGFTFPRKARVALDTFRKAQKEIGTIPGELAKVVAHGIAHEDVTVEQMVGEIHDLGYESGSSPRIKFCIPTAAFIVNREDDQQGVDYLIRATGKDEVDFVESYLSKGPFELRSDLGKDADEARRKYVTIDNDKET